MVSMIFLVHIGIVFSNNVDTISVSCTKTFLEEPDMLDHLLLTLKPLRKIMETIGTLITCGCSTISSRIISATGTKSFANILGSSSNKLIKNSREPLIDKVSNVTWIIWVVAIVVTHVFFKNITQVCNGTWEISETTDTLLAGGSGVIREVKVQNLAISERKFAFAQTATDNTRTMSFI